MSSTACRSFISPSRRSLIALKAPNWATSPGHAAFNLVSGRSCVSRASKSFTMSAVLPSCRFLRMASAFAIAASLDSCAKRGIARPTTSATITGGTFFVMAHHPFALFFDVGMSVLVWVKEGCLQADRIVAACSRPSSTIEISRMRNFWILPVTVIGNSVEKRMYRGIL